MTPLKSPSDDRKPGKAVSNPFPSFAPRFWHGMTSRIWWKLLAENRFRVSLNRFHIVAGVTFTTPFNDICGALQHTIYGRQIAKTSLKADPIFVLGHWRSGTTLMHELLHLDDRYSSPNTYQCFAPWHFVLTEYLMCRFGNFLLPKRRPMDNMKVGWTLPQEDEFALMALGVPTPYRKIAFPQHPVPHMDCLGSKTFDKQKLEEWKKSLDWFFRAVTYKTQKPLIIKSPPHTGRLAILAEMYPGAKFIHMIRDPRKLYPSTIKLWSALEEVQAIQQPSSQESQHKFVIESLHRMYDAFEIDRQSIASDRIIDIKYEDLVADPISTLRSIYSQWKLKGFDHLLPKIAARQLAEKDYQTNEHRIDANIEKIVLRDWIDYAKKYGYLENRLAP